MGWSEVLLLMVCMSPGVAGALQEPPVGSRLLPINQRVSQQIQRRYGHLTSGETTSWPSEKPLSRAITLGSPRRRVGAGRPWHSGSCQRRSPPRTPRVLRVLALLRDQPLPTRVFCSRQRCPDLGGAGRRSLARPPVLEQPVQIRAGQSERLALVEVGANPIWPLPSANTDSVCASTSRCSAVSRTLHGSTLNAGCRIMRPPRRLREPCRRCTDPRPSSPRTARAGASRPPAADAIACDSPAGVAQSVRAAES